MPTVTFQTGQKVQFKNQPTPQDIEEVANKLGISKITNTPTQNAPTSGGNFGSAVHGVTDFLGIEKAGQGLATTGRYLTGQTAQDNQSLVDTANSTKDLLDRMSKLPVGSPERLKLNQVLKKLTGNNAIQNSTPEQVDPGMNLSNKEVIGSFGNVLGDVLAGSSGLSNTGKLANVAEKINAIAQPLDKAKIAGRLGNAAISGTAQGIFQGASQALNDNKSAADVAKQAIGSGIVSGGLSTGVQGLSELVKALTEPKITQKIVDKSIGTPKNKILAGKSPAQDIIDAGVPKTKTGLLADANNQITKANNQIKEILPSVTTMHETAPILDAIKQDLADNYAGALNKEDINKIVDSLPLAALKDNKTIDTVQLNKLRQVIDNKYIGNSKWLNTAGATTENVSALKTAANAMRETVKSTDERLAPLFEQLSKGINQKTILDNELAKHHILNNLLEVAASTGVGLGTGGVSLKGAAHGLASLAALKTILSTPAQTGLAIGLDRLGKAQAKIPNSAKAQAIKSVGNVVKQRLIQQALK